MDEATVSAMIATAIAAATVSLNTEINALNDEIATLNARVASGGASFTDLDKEWIFSVLKNYHFGDRPAGWQG